MLAACLFILFLPREWRENIKREGSVVVVWSEGKS